MRRKVNAVWLGVAMGFSAVCAFCAEELLIVAPVSATASTTWAGTPGYVSPNYLIDGSGLTGAGRSATHSNASASGLFWHSNTGIVVANQWLEFDLGVVYDISNALVWQLAQSGLTLRGVKTFTIKVAGPDRVFSTLSTGNPLNQATGAANEPVQVVSLATPYVRYVRFEIQTNWGASGIVGLSEVRFEAMLPEPRDLTWNGTAGNATWDFVSANWLTNGEDTVFQHVDNVLFDDGASEKQVAITTNLTVGTIVVDNAETYRISCGTNANRRITFATAFVKSGTGTLELGGGTYNVASSYHTFTNDVVIEQGTVKTLNHGRDQTNPPEGLLGNPSVPRTIVVTNGATLHFGGNNVLGNGLSTPQAHLIVADGGILESTAYRSNPLGPTLFDNGVIAQLSGNVPGWAALIFNGDVTFRGTTPYTVSGINGAALSFGYAVVPSVHVEEITGDAAADVTFNVPLINFGNGMPSRFRKIGQGTLRLVNTGSSFTGDVVVAEGVVEVASGAVSNSVVSVLGNPKAARKVRVESGAILRFTGSNTIATGFDSPKLELEIAGGTLSLANGSSSVFGPLTLEDATVTYNGGYSATDWGMMIFSKRVTFKGTQPVVFSPAGANSNLQSGLNEETEMNVWDITGSSAIDVRFNLPFINFGAAITLGRPGSRFRKTGPGTLSLGAVNTSTGALRVVEGVLRVDGKWAAVNSSVTAENGGYLGGTGTVARAVFSGGGFECTMNQTGQLTAATAVIGATGSVRVLNPDGLPVEQVTVPFLSFSTIEGAENLVSWTVEVEGAAGSDNLRVRVKDGVLVAGWAPPGTVILIY